MLVGMPFDYCKTMCLELVKKHGLDYDSKEAAVTDRDKMPVGVTSDSDLVRHRLADLMYDARQRDHALTSSMAPGLPAKQAPQTVVTGQRLYARVDHVARGDVKQTKRNN